MGRSTSVIMTPAQQAKADKAKEKELAAKQKVKDLKADLKEAKLDAADTKRRVAVEMKNFLAVPAKEEAKCYKDAVAAHIKAVQTADKLAAKLA